MLYRLLFLDGEGNPYTISGFKDVKDDPGFNPMEIWKDTSTLYTKVLRGRVSAAMVKFGKLFLGSLWEVYGPSSKG